MKIARYEHGSQVRLGAVQDQEIRPFPVDATVLQMLAMTPLQRSEITLGDPVAIPEIRLLAPISPTSLRDFVTFEEHVEGIVRSHQGPNASPPPEWYEAPTFYFTNAGAVIGPFDDVPIAPGSTALDFELEVAAVVCREGRDLSPEAAAGVIGGYTILNDWSARDLQLREMRVSLGPCKGKDFANTLGPWIVTVDELEPWRRDGRLDLDLRVWINDEPYGDDTLANMAWSFEEMVAYASRGTRVRPGDVLGSGTCGRGCLAEIWGRTGQRHPPALRPGDVVQITVEGIGTIRNQVVVGAQPITLGSARPPHRRARAT